jgi:CHAD domain-containing protein
MATPAMAGYATYPFADQADVCVNSRLAADAVGATKMDRPEWSGGQPGQRRDLLHADQQQQPPRSPTGSQLAPDAANPRVYSDIKGTSTVSTGNPNGHIIRVKPRRQRRGRLTFTWDIYLFGAESRRARRDQPVRLTADQDFSSPDGLVFTPVDRHLLDPDRRRRLHRRHQLHDAGRRAGPGRRWREADGEPGTGVSTSMGGKPDGRHAEALPGRPQGLRDHRRVRNPGWQGAVHQHPASGRDHRCRQRRRPGQVRKPLAGQCRLRRGRHGARGRRPSSSPRTTAAASAPEATALSAGSAMRVRLHLQVKRACRTVRSGATRIRITFDEGHLRCAEKQGPVCELAFELQAGPQAGLVTVVSRWIERHGLWFGTSATFALTEVDAQALGQLGSTRVSGSPLSTRLAPGEALPAMVGSCLEQLMPNAELVAAGVGSPVHLHQTRVALRRLRTALRVFGPWSPALDPRWDVVLRDVFQRLGAARDTDAVAAALTPQLAAAGAPLAQPPKAPSVESPAQVLRHGAFNRVLTELIVFCSQESDTLQGDHEPVAPPVPGRTIKPLSRAVLKRLHHQVVRDTPGFLAADDAARHRTRKRLKRLRYSVEFLAPLFRDKAVARYLKSLRKALD